MATVTLGLLNHQELHDADTSTSNGKERLKHGNW